MQDAINIEEVIRIAIEAGKAILEIYRRLRPGDPSTVQQAKTYFTNLFFNATRYDLSEVGRVKLNHKLHKADGVEETVLTQKDIVEAVRHLG